MSITQKRECNSCGGTLSEKVSCVSCPGATQNISVSVHEDIKLHENMRLRREGDGFRKFISEHLSGWFPSWDKDKHPEGVQKTRVIDKESDRYSERVVDEATGKVVRDVTEALSEHRK